MNIIKGAVRGSAPAGLVRIDVLDWAAARGEASRIRIEVFVREQGVPLELEMDESDPLSLHVLAADPASGAWVGTARLLPDGHIGRMAVAAGARRRGIGRAMLDVLIARARERGDGVVIVHAQTHAAAFYERAGFAVSSAVFDEAGIPHVEMRLSLTAA